MDSKKLGVLAASIMTGLVTTVALAKPKTVTEGKQEFFCLNNQCKGHSACAGAGSASCAGKNECKGKGWLEAKSKADCEKDGKGVWTAFDAKKHG